MKGFAAAIMIAVTTLCMGVAQAQGPAPSINPQRGLEIAGGFATVRANAAPTDCGCFFMYGANVQAALVGHSGVGVVADFGRTSADNINGEGNDLTLSTYMGGVRYVPRFRVKRFSTYVQALVGVAHTSSNYAIDADATRLAASAGGGINYVLTRRWDFRVLEASYLMTRIPNAANEYQNQLRLTTGVVFRISR
jgi:peptidoglycan-associated lipoprotein